MLAWKRSRRGAFSASSRISAFLTGLSVLPVELRHKPGKEMLTSDFASRNPPQCSSNKCQICSFVEEWQLIGDNASNVRSLSIEDIKSGTAIMPLTQKKVWKNIQSRDPVHSKLIHLIDTRQLPETRKRKGDHTKLKLLHNLFTQGKLFIEDGLVLVKTPDGHFNDAAISVPSSIFPGIINALHMRLDHPSKGQLKALASRYFYSPGWRNVIDTVSDFCHQCVAVKSLPKVLIEDSSTPPNCFGSNFAADVIERETQKILVIREGVTQFTRATIVSDQKKDTLRQALLSMILDILPDSGSEIRLDGATAFQSLEIEALTKDTLFNKLGVRIVIGRTLNKNKNPIGENAVKELQKEILRYKQGQGQITQTDLAVILRNINSRVRYNGLTAKEMVLRRDNLSNVPIDVKDDQVISDQSTSRKLSSKASLKHKAKFQKPSPSQLFKVGDLVMLRGGLSKNKPRETFIIDSMPSDNSKFILIRKLSQSLRPKLYKALPDELISLPLHGPQPTKPLRRKAAEKANTKIKSNLMYVSHARKKFKHGWIEEDQPEDYDDIILVPATQDSYTDLQPSNPNYSPTNLNSRPRISSSSSRESSNSTEDLIWDYTPSQYTLTPPLLQSCHPHHQSPPFHHQRPFQMLNLSAYLPLQDPDYSQVLIQPSPEHQPSGTMEVTKLFF